MKDKSTAVAVLIGGIFALLLLLLFWWRTDAFSGSTQCGSRSLSPADACITAMNATDDATGGNFDSFDSPLGTAYSPARTFAITGISLTADGTDDLTVTLGYGDDYVQDSGTDPTGKVTLFSTLLPAQTGIYRIPLAVNVPAGKYPWAWVNGPAIWPSKVVLSGVER